MIVQLETERSQTFAWQSAHPRPSRTALTKQRALTDAAVAAFRAGVPAGQAEPAGRGQDAGRRGHDHAAGRVPGLQRDRAGGLPVRQLAVQPAGVPAVVPGEPGGPAERRGGRRHRPGSRAGRRRVRVRRHHAGRHLPAVHPDRGQPAAF
jgi:hypothetical protein